MKHIVVVVSTVSTAIMSLSLSAAMFMAVVNLGDKINHTEISAWLINGGWFSLLVGTVIISFGFFAIGIILYDIIRDTVVEVQDYNRTRKILNRR